MNILIDELPESVGIGGEQYRINSNFRNIVLAEQALNDANLDEHERIAVVLDLFYIDEPAGVADAIGAFSDFYVCYASPARSKGGKGTTPAVLSTEHDAALIYTAFQRTYGINLNQVEYLHWFEFKAMLEDLDDGCRLSKIMEYRGVNLSEIKDKNMKKFYSKMKKLHAIPLDKDTQARLDSLADVLKNGGDVKAALEGR